MKILAVSDVVLNQMQDSTHLHSKYRDVELLVSCGDMPPGYLDYIGSTLNVPLFFVRGNHDTNYGPGKPGGDNLHLRIQTFRGLTFAGLEGSICYNYGDAQYSQHQMMFFVLRMLPRLLLLRSMRGYGVDLFVAHSPPEGIHDIPEDRAHQGFRSFLRLMKWTHPRYLLHGHVDTWDRRRATESQFYKTTVFNINPVKLLDVSPLSD